jgi:hypothetical protein
MIIKRRRFKQTISLKDRLASFAKQARAHASHLPPSKEKDDLLKSASRADTAVHIDKWINSPGLQPPAGRG